MKILLINAINPYSGIEGRYPPLGLGYLVSYLRKCFGSDFLKFKVIEKDVETEINEFQPDIVGITSVTQNFNLAKRYSKVAKLKNIPVIVGGIHISMLPTSLSEDMDIGVIGEAEDTIVDLIKAFLNRNSFVADELKKIHGIVFWENGKLNFTEKRKLIEPLDKIPFPSRDLFNIEKNTYVFSSRGCPYRCIFCASSRYWDKVRYFSAEYVVEEIDELVNLYKVEIVNFYDDLMMANKKRLINIVELLKKKPYYRKVKFTANARANILTDDIVHLLKEMNVFSVGMGLESGSKRVLNYLKGNSVTLEDNIRAIKLLKKYKISPNASFVIGSPDETETEILETLNFIKKSGLDIADAYVLTPFPGTPIWEIAKERGLVSDDMDWSRLSVSYYENHKKAIILSKTLSNDRLFKLFLKFRLINMYLVLKKILLHPSIMISGIKRLKNIINNFIKK
ncbi:hypothetical protein A2230_08165 [candidate division WOR-1 bacterium RIFOXYA2_FULL_36_21]|uniref:Uncharacterized protein n=1 Tax=candidate division WOR-1 bacterium RIFOXYB2_FULL_36_35 TaxID=1802578 RepID=A0A1F4S8A4_UNCSA|nr:MAG: hypothetical protein A2230_08165 [candidate division WOR-1 bacterium RIFOXYA2_FULL_36_21]OGC14616.1 MAG: hypothetical protein A2282_04180 [candidate division WOR-1 bacterium RIFOXYA12_FULL_36_13]OGC16631.1 MAG: hypothetical protein A2290_03380 [candidate division WOR-1 bacterium RIFOXYB2_FULL_36_35]